MVVIFLPSAAATGSTQERTAAPSTCTVHAPHCAMPQPYLVPVRPTCSRIAHSRGVLGLTLTSSVLPLIVKRAMSSLPGSQCNECAGKYLRSRPRTQGILQQAPVVSVTQRGGAPRAARVGDQVRAP